MVALFTRAWIEMFNFALVLHNTSVALFTRAWIEISSAKDDVKKVLSPSSRGRGLKCKFGLHIWVAKFVALFTRAWIEIFVLYSVIGCAGVALFTRAWIEIYAHEQVCTTYVCRPLHEGVD